MALRWDRKGQHSHCTTFKLPPFELHHSLEQRFVNPPSCLLIFSFSSAIELSCRSRPGKICQIEENPTDSNKLLIGFESGYLVSWNISEKIAETRYRCHAELTCIFWHHEGKQFMTGHRDGLIAIWNVKSTEPTAKFNPHQDEKESEADRVRLVLLCRAACKIILSEVAPSSPQSSRSRGTASRTATVSSSSLAACRFIARLTSETLSRSSEDPVSPCLSSITQSLQWKRLSRSRSLIICPLMTISEPLDLRKRAA